MNDDDDPDCPSETCPMCIGELCLLCGAGSWNNDPHRNCQHNVLERHTLPSPSGDSDAT